MKIAYLDFWPTFQPEKSWLTRLLTDHFNGDLQIVPPDDASCIIYSCFPDKERTRFKYYKSNKLFIFYSGENVRPRSCPFYHWSLSFDETGGRNFRLPLWYMYIDWWNTGEPDLLPLSSLTMVDPDSSWGRPRDCIIVASNFVYNRKLMVHALEQAGVGVDKFGLIFDNPIKGSKTDLLSAYRFNICFENALYPGYVTEKVLQAKACGCVPITWFGPNSDFNMSGLINTAGMSISDAASVVNSINCNRHLYVSMAAQPLFTIPPTLDTIHKYLSVMFANYNVIS